MYIVESASVHVNFFLLWTWCSNISWFV